VVLIRTLSCCSEVFSHEDWSHECSLNCCAVNHLSYFYCPRELHSSEENEGFLDVAINSLGFLTEHVEADSLGEGTALTDSHDVTDGKTESGGLVASNGVMALFKSVVFSDEVEVITTDDDVVGHFVGDNDTPFYIYSMLDHL